ASGPNCYTVHVCITKLEKWHFEFMELLIGVWTQAYDAMMEDWCLNFNMIEDYEKHHSDLSVRYIFWVSEASMVKLEKEDLRTKFKLMESIFTSNLMCFNKSSLIKCYASTEEILTKFYNIRLQFYHKCKVDLMYKLIQEHTKLSNQAHFILDINEELEMHNITHADLNSSSLR
ncbi:DNA topoisomerase 2, partial [Massospora cicadina]